MALALQKILVTSHNVFTYYLSLDARCDGMEEELEEARLARLVKLKRALIFLRTTNYRLERGEPLQLQNC
jgi:hypothetical protein